jgi:hypothetical protein
MGQTKYLYEVLSVFICRMNHICSQAAGPIHTDVNRQVKGPSRLIKIAKPLKSFAIFAKMKPYSPDQANRRQ